MALELSDPVETHEKLREIIPEWSGNASKKDLNRVNEVARAFIGMSPYVVISSGGVDDRHDDGVAGPLVGVDRLPGRTARRYHHNLVQARADRVELALDGQVRSVTGLLPMAVAVSGSRSIFNIAWAWADGSSAVTR